MTDMEEGLFSSEELDEVLNMNLPHGATVSSSSVDDERLMAAAVTASRTGSTLPLVKEELRQRIILKRHKAGKPEIKPEFPPPKEYQLTPAEKARKARRREQNRRAAKKCRDKKRAAASSVEKDSMQAIEENKELHKQVGQLKQHSNKLQRWLLDHAAVCSVCLQGSQSEGQQQRHHLHDGQQRQRHHQRHHQEEAGGGGSSSHQHSPCLRANPASSRDSNAIRVVTPCRSAGCLPHQPALSSQGFDTVCRALCAFTADQLNCPPAATVSGAESLAELSAASCSIPSSAQPRPPPQCSISTQAAPQKCAARTSTTTSATNTTSTADPPKVFSSKFEGLFGLSGAQSSSLTDGRMSEPLNVSHVVDTVLTTTFTRQKTENSFTNSESLPGCAFSDTDSASLDLPGYPFSVQKKRKSTGSSRQQSAKRVCNQPVVKATSSTTEPGTGISGPSPTTTLGSHRCIWDAAVPVPQPPSPTPAMCSVWSAVTPPPRSVTPSFYALTSPSPTYFSDNPVAPPDHDFSSKNVPPFSATTPPFSADTPPPPPYIAHTPPSPAGLRHPPSLPVTLPFSSALTPPPTRPSSSCVLNRRSPVTPPSLTLPPVTPSPVAPSHATPTPVTHTTVTPTAVAHTTVTPTPVTHTTVTPTAVAHTTVTTMLVYSVNTPSSYSVVTASPAAAHVGPTTPPPPPQVHVRHLAVAQMSGLAEQQPPAQQDWNSGTQLPILNQSANDLNQLPAVNQRTNGLNQTPVLNQSANDLNQLPGLPNFLILSHCVGSSGDYEEESQSQCSSSLSLHSFLQDFISSSQED